MGNKKLINKAEESIFKNFLDTADKSDASEEIADQFLNRLNKIQEYKIRENTLNEKKLKSCLLVFGIPIVILSLMAFLYFKEMVSSEVAVVSVLVSTATCWVLYAIPTEKLTWLSGMIDKIKSCKKN